MNFLGLGSTELLVVVVLGLLILGPKQLVKFARKAGKAVRRMQEMTGELTKSITDAVSEDEETPAKESPDREKKKRPRLAKIAEEIKQALTLEEEKPAATSDSGEEASPAAQSPAKAGEQIGQTLHKISDEINQALNPRKPPSGDSPGGTNE
jgi:sec-independent protein translocase protein TatB